MSFFLNLVLSNRISHQRMVSYSFESYNKPSTNHLVITKLNLDKPYGVDVFDRYTSVAKGSWKRLEIPTKSMLNFETFNRALDSAGLSILEGRARAIFNACDANRSGHIYFDEFVVSLMVNDAYPTIPGCMSLYDVFLSFDFDNQGTLTLAQFRDCVHFIEIAQKSKRFKNRAFLADLFRKETKHTHGRIRYKVFKMIYSKKIANSYHRLVKKDLMQTSHRMSGQRFKNPLSIIRNMFRNSRQKILWEFENDAELLTDLVTVQKQVSRHK